VRNSLTMASGCSQMPKWPPRGITVQRCRLVILAAIERGTSVTSFGCTAKPHGTSITGMRIVQGFDGHTGAKVLPIAAQRCPDRARQIVDGCERAQEIPVVDGEQVAVAVAPRAPPLPYPGRRSCRRVHPRVGEGLWIVAVDSYVTRAQGSGRGARSSMPRSHHDPAASSSASGTAISKGSGLIGACMIPRDFRNPEQV
jgi:hypothetical protein